jgi:hypothetical protein
MAKNSSQPEQAQKPERKPRRDQKAREDQNRKRVKDKEEKEAPEICTNVGNLLPDEIALINQMLIEGSTFEDVAEAITESGRVKLTARVVERHFRSDPELQERRIVRQVEVARRLREALAGPRSEQTDLAESVLFMGLMGLSRRTAAQGMQQAMRYKHQQENVRLREDAFNLKVEKLEMDKKLLETRLKMESMKHEMLAQKFQSLKEAAERASAGDALSPEILKQIHEIYGLVSPVEAEPASQENAHA